MMYRYLCRDWKHPRWDACYVAFTHLPKVGIYANGAFEWHEQRGHGKVLSDKQGDALAPTLQFGGIVRLPHGLKGVPR